MEHRLSSINLPAATIAALIAGLSAGLCAFTMVGLGTFVEQCHEIVVRNPENRWRWLLEAWGKATFPVVGATTVLAGSAFATFGPRGRYSLGVSTAIIGFGSVVIWLLINTMECGPRIPKADDFPTRTFLVNVLLISVPPIACSIWLTSQRLLRK